jgi:tetratricopeptide (TPR) repeat protein
MELRDQLESALGATYAIENELGGGGMSRVFVATESALGRRVVIKVVPLEAGAGVNLERFKRETLLAANLQHPHIVPVLSAGEIDGVPYYTMPFIEGESLRSRLAKGPLPLSEAVSVLRDVARALAYAHERGVVHRDIKPDNVLLTAGSATVTDFGIAKAISASRATAAESTLTQLGTSVGTPAYMAPEQAAADPTTDHRADIYAFGCMAYELLAGRPPFAGLTPTKLLMAHMSERPKPIDELRPDTPPMLAALVMQCLEKEPDARPQRAADLVRILDAVTSGSTASMPALAMGGPGALRRALAYYAIGFIAVALVAKAATIVVGLPDWVTPASLWLMGLGLPIILATAYVQRVARRSILSTPSVTPRGGSVPPSTMQTLALRASPYLSWRRSAMSIASVVGGFALMVATLLALRPFGLGPLASLMANGKLNVRDKILIADFTSTGADTSLGPVVAEAVRADLGQSPIVAIVTAQTVASTLQMMQLPPTTRVDTGLARQIAKREGVKAIVSGDVHSLAGGGYVVTMRLVSADSGQELASATESAGGARDLIPTIGRATRRLRSRMGESLKHVQASAELAQVTTRSIEALQKYSAGQRALSVEVNPNKAIPLFREAIAIDTGFAAAYRALAIALGNSNQDREGQIRALEHAYAHADRLPEVERYLTIASYWSQGPRPDVKKAEQAYESVLVIRPTQSAALNNLALIRAQRRDFAGAEQLLRRSIAANPTALTAYSNLVGYEAEQGKLAAMESTFTAQLRVSGNNPRVAATGVNMLFSRGKYDSTDALIDSIVKANPGQLDLLQQQSATKQATALVRGRLVESLRYSSQNALFSKQLNQPAALLSASVDSALVDAWFRGSKAKAVTVVQAGLERTPLESIPPLDRPYAALAQIYALAGRPDLARPMLEELDRTTGTMTPDGVAALRHSILSLIALAERRYMDAAHEAIAADNGPCTTCTAPLIAYAYDNANQPDSALVEYTKYVESTSILNRFGNDGFLLAGAYKRLGELWEAKGDRGKALEYYSKFVSLWKDADPELQPKVSEVRKRIAIVRDTES